MLNDKNILETINMITQEHLDVRTITMGISLHSCVDENIQKCTSKIYDKICRKAENLVAVGCNIEKEYGIPIIHKRISVTPISLIAAAAVGDNPNFDCTPFADALQRAADMCGVNFIGGFSALVQKGFSVSDIALLNSIPEALSSTRNVCSSVNIASTKAGINMDAVKMMGGIIKKLAYITREQDSIGCAKLVVFANVPEDNPFMAGAFHGSGEGENMINVGVSGPGVVKKALEKCDGDLSEVAETVKKTAFKITRMGQLVAAEASKRLGVPFGIVDLSLAPTPAIGDSVAHILEEMGLESCGACGTTAALALLNDAVKKGGVMASSQVGGLSGAFIPVSEDAGMIAAAQKGALTIEKLEAMTAVCSVGLDMIAIPGDTPEAVISALIADEASIGVVNSKTTAVRVIPAYGKKIGDSVSFGGLLGEAPIMKISTYSPEKFISRGGRIPAPIQSLKN